MTQRRARTWWLYLVLCRDRSIYTGIATDVARRLAEHREGGLRAARYLRGRGPLRLLIAQPVGRHGDALRLEMQVKRLASHDKRQFARRPDELRRFIDAALTARGNVGSTATVSSRAGSTPSR